MVYGMWANQISWDLNGRRTLTKINDFTRKQTNEIYYLLLFINTCFETYEMMSEVWKLADEEKGKKTAKP